MKRNYRREYKLFHSKTIQKKRRAGRNHARRLMLRLGKVKKFSLYDIDHKNHNTLDNRPKNLRIMTKYKNRSIK
jgi:hypothetical protein